MDKDLLHHIVSNPFLHAKWLNTLSYLENCGARKISACEHPIEVSHEMLKHAAEEFRHALILKQQIRKVSELPFIDYRLESLLGGYATWHYLSLLDVWTSRYLIHHVNSLKTLSYILVTYAIELRAKELYPLYQQVLIETSSKVSVRLIIYDEDQHLREMEEAIRKIPEGEKMSTQICAYEETLYKKWLLALSL